MFELGVISRAVAPEELEAAADAIVSRLAVAGAKALFTADGFYHRGKQVSLKLSAEPLVSVIIPTYNRAALVQEAVASVQAQTYRDFETVVVTAECWRAISALTRSAISPKRTT